MIKELINGNYFIYQLSDGGCGIVKAESKVKAVELVIDAYNSQHSGTYYESEITVTEIVSKNRLFKNHPNVLELGWSIQI